MCSFTCVCVYLQCICEFMLVISTASCGWLLTVPHPPTHPTPQKLCMKVIEFVDHMARKLRSNRYYLEEREKQDVKLLVMSEKVRLTELCACAYVYYGLVSCSCLAPLTFGCFRNGYLWCKHPEAQRG